MTSLKPRNLLTQISTLLAAGCFLATLCTLNAATVFKEVASYPGYPRGPVLNAQIVGQYAYLAADLGGLIILDISNPVCPVKVGQCDTPGYIRNVEVAGNIAYCTGNTGIQVIDVSDRTSPRLFKEIPMNSAGSFRVSGGFGYLLLFNGINIFDLSNPLNPVFITGTTTTIRNVLFEFAVSGDYIFVVNSSSEVLIFESKNGAKPSLITQFKPGLKVVDIEVVDNLAYITVNGDLRIYDVTDKMNPKEVSSIPAAAMDVSIKGDKAYLTASIDEVVIVDIADPASPKILGSTKMPSAVLNIGENFAIGALSTLHLLDFSDPSSIKHLSDYNIDGYATKIDINENTAYLADGRGGLRIVDITDPLDPKLASHLLKYGTQHVKAANGMVYLAIGSAGLRVMDAANPTNLLQLKVISEEGISFNRIDVDDEKMIVAHTTNGFSLYDLKNPAEPLFQSRYDTDGIVRAVKLAGNLAFIADGSSGLLIFNISDLTKPALLGSYNTPGEALQLEVKGTTVFIADNNGGMQIVDVSDPTAPAFLGSFAANNASMIEVNGDLAYLGASPNGLYVLDISNPALPVKVGQYSTLNPGDIYFLGNHLFFADLEYGLTVVEPREVPVTFEIKRVRYQGQFIWPDYGVPIRVQKTQSLSSPTGWSDLLAPKTIVGKEYQMNLPLDGTQSFFRFYLQN